MKTNMNDQTLLWTTIGLRIAAEIAAVWAVSHALGSGFWLTYGVFYAVVITLWVYAFLRDWVIFRLLRSFTLQTLAKGMTEAELPKAKRYYDDLGGYLNEVVEDETSTPKAKFSAGVIAGQIQTAYARSSFAGWRLSKLWLKAINQHGRAFTGTSPY